MPHKHRTFSFCCGGWVIKLSTADLLYQHDAGLEKCSLEPLRTLTKQEAIVCLSCRWHRLCFSLLERWQLLIHGCNFQSTIEVAITASINICSVHDSIDGCIATPSHIMRSESGPEAPSPNLRTRKALRASALGTLTRAGGGGAQTGP